MRSDPWMASVRLSMYLCMYVRAKRERETASKQASERLIVAVA